MRIVKPTAQSRQTVGKTTVLRPFILEGHLLVGGYHPTHCSTHFDAVGEGSEYPGAVASHRPSGTADALGIHLGHRGEIFRSGNIVVGHIGRKVNAVHHHISGYHVIQVTLHTLLQSALSPHRGVGREYHVTVLSQIIAKELPLVSFRPFLRILDDGGVFTSQRTDALLLADEEVASVVVQHVDSRERSFAIGNQHVGWHRIILRESYLYLASLVTVALFFIDDLRLVAVSRCRRRCQHTVEHLLARSFSPLAEVFDIAIAPCQRIGQVGNQRISVGRQIAHKLIPLPVLGRTADGDTADKASQ